MTVDTSQEETRPLSVDEYRARHRRTAAGWIIGLAAFALIAAPAGVTLLLGLDASGDQCADPPTFDAPACEAAPGYFVILVALVALPPLLGLVVARPQRLTRKLAVVGIVALISYALLLLLA